MYVIEQEVFVPQAAIPRSTFGYDIIDQRFTYNLGNFTTAVVTSGPNLTAAQFAAARLAFLDGATLASGFNVRITGGTDDGTPTGTPLAPVTFDTTASAGVIQFSGKTFTVIGAAATAVAAGRTRLELVGVIPARTLLNHIIYPADRCTWVQEPSSDGGGYAITSATFYNGNDDGTELRTSSIPGAHVGPVRLGYIGKSGRFVAITDAS